MQTSSFLHRLQVAAGKLSRKRKSILIAAGLCFCLVGLMLILQKRYLVVINYTKSLPDKVFILKRNAVPISRDQVIAFKTPETAHYYKSKVMLKLVGGLPGDTVEVRRILFKNNEEIGEIKSGTDVPKYFYTQTPIEIVGMAEPYICSGKSIDDIRYNSRYNSCTDDHLVKNYLYLNGQRIGFIKKEESRDYSKEWHFGDKSRELAPIAQTGIIPEGKIFAYTKHPDSYDSRYNDVGLISITDIIGVGGDGSK